MMMMRTGRILERRAVEGAVLAMAMTMTTARVRRTRKGGEKGTGQGKGTKDGKGKGKGKGNGNGKGKGIVKQTPVGDDISRAVALPLQKERYEADSGTEG
jgi:hypothetical protein